VDHLGHPAACPPLGFVAPTALPANESVEHYGWPAMVSGCSSWFVLLGLFSLAGKPPVSFVFALLIPQKTVPCEDHPHPA
jgi:hypothetical protein